MAGTQKEDFWEVQVVGFVNFVRGSITCTTLTF